MDERFAIEDYGDSITSAAGYDGRLRFTFPQKGLIANVDMGH